MDACLPYMAAGAAIVGAMWYTQQMPPPHARFSDATACSARRAAVSARAAATTEEDGGDFLDKGLKPSDVDGDDADKQFAGVRPAMHAAPPSVDSAGVRARLMETLSTKNRGAVTLQLGRANIEDAKCVPDSLQDKMFNAPEC